jgi:uncharacterized delta-60 repeat protein
MSRILLAVFALLIAATAARAETADASFGTNGRYIYGGAGTLEFRAVATLPIPGGRVVSVFQFPPFEGFCAVPACLALARFNENGVLDRVRTFDNNLEEVTAAAVDNSGRIVVVARTNSGAAGRDIHVARFLISDLERDLSFAGGTGWANFSYNARDEYPRSVAIDRSDRIIVGGTFTFSDTDTDFGFTMIKSDGTLDTNFNNSGHRAVAIDIATSIRLDVGNAVAIADNGDIIGVGNAFDANVSRVRVAVVRLKPNGSLQPTFCPSGCNYNAGYSTINSGRTIYQFALDTTHSDEGLAIDTYKDGYVIAGATYNDDGSNRRAVLARFDNAGDLKNERITASLGNNGVFNSVKAIGSPPTRYVAAGNSGADNNFLMVQAFTQTLNFETGYGDCQPNNNGFCPIFASLLADWGPDIGRSISIDARGRVLLAGQGISTEGSKSQVMTARFTNDTGPLPDVIYRSGFN